MALWDPLHPSDPFSFQFGNYALLILNREITLQPACVEKLWNEAAFKATVDGGTDRWLNYLQKHNINIKSKFPDLISGDFDSIKAETLEYFKENGVAVECTPDQNYTDFQKCLQLVLKKYHNELTSVVVLCDTSGRIDQLLEILNTLGKVHTLTECYDHPPIFLLARNSLTWLLTKGEHTIKIPQYLICHEVWCAIMPYEPVRENRITTTGLKWNLDNMSLQFGGLISSSNTYSGEPEVTVKTDSKILWSMGMLKEVLRPHVLVATTVKAPTQCWFEFSDPAFEPDILTSGMFSKNTGTPKLDCVVAICESDGDRLDHVLQNINTAGRVKLLGNLTQPVYLLSSHTLVWYLPKGRHQIVIPRYLIQNKAWCGVLPYEPVQNHVTSTGLKWNLENHFVAFGNMVSTSNTYNGEPHVTISTDAGLIWMMGLCMNK